MRHPIKNLKMGIWLLWYLRQLNDIDREIKKYRALGDIEHEKAAILKATNKWGPDMMKAAGVNVHVEGRENIPQEGPVVFVSNHQSYGDIPAFMVAVQTKQFGFVAKKDLGNLPLYGKWITNIRSVYIERDDPRESLKAMDRGIELLKQGFSLVLFPEGTRSRGGQMGEFKKGSLRLATKPGVPIVPITLNGTWHIYEEHGCPHAAEVDFYIHPPIATEGLTKQEASALAPKVEQIIRQKLEEMQSK